MTARQPVDQSVGSSSSRYRAWYDTAREVRTAAPAWTRDVTGQLLVIMRQQNEEVIWKYADISLLCDVAERNGLNCIGLFGWTKGGHDHLYPDYDPSDEMGGVAALKAGIAEAHRRGIRVYIYANGQLQQVGATAFWEEHGERLALVKKDGSRVIQTYHKYKDIPKYEFALGCLYGKPWHDRMLALAEQANGFGADDGTSAVCVWNVSDQPAEVKLEGLSEPTAVAAPGAESVDGPLAANALRLYIFAAAPSRR